MFGWLVNATEQPQLGKHLSPNLSSTIYLILASLKVLITHGKQSNNYVRFEDIFSSSNLVQYYFFYRNCHHFKLTVQHSWALCYILADLPVIVSDSNCHLAYRKQTFHCGHKGSPQPPVPAKPNTLYSRGRFVDMVCWTVGQGPGLSLEPSKKVNYLDLRF